MEFIPFPKMCRLNRDIVITEKIDGTNAQIYITEPDSEGNMKILAGSRTRWITPEEDNYGFARWVRDNAKELIRLGPGQHFGEWWGSGIQRKYGMQEKVFSLFNTHRWSDPNLRPACCSVVPVLYQGVFDTTFIEEVLIYLKTTGSQAAPGFMKPEGIVVFHTAGNFCMKKTIEKDEVPKSTWIKK